MYLVLVPCILEEDNFAIQYIIENQNSGMLYICWCHLNKL